MLLLNLTEKEILTGVVSLTDTSYTSLLLCTEFEQAVSITVETGDRCIKFVQRTANKKIARISLT